MCGDGKASIFIAIVICSMAQLSMGIMSKMTPLKKAAYKGDLAEVKRLIEEGTDVNGELQHGFTPLHWAILQGNVEVAECLISSGADVDLYRMEPHTLVVGTPLHCAAYKGDIKLAELLISNDADKNASHPNPVLASGGTPLHEAVRGGSRDMVSFLIAHGAEINARARKHQTPLHFARDKDIAGLLIESSAVLDAMDEDGWTPLNYAADYENREVADLLAKEGAELTLHTASYIGDLNRLKSFIERGADVNTKGMRGRTPLYFAANAKIAQYLIAKNAVVDARDAYGMTPLHQASRIGQRGVAEVLIAYGANINAKDRWGDTSAKVAAFKGNKEVFLLLIGAGVDLKINGPAFLFTAASSGHTDIVGYLIESGVKIDTRAKNSYTPMHIAVFMGHKDTAELLIDNGADVNTRTESGVTPLHTAVLRRHKEIIRLLLSKGADVNARDQENLTPLDIATKSTDNTEDIKELLRNHDV